MVEEICSLIPYAVNSGSKICASVFNDSVRSYLYSL